MLVILSFRTTAAYYI